MPETSQHLTFGLSKQVAHNIGKLFNLLFNRAVLNYPDHPYAVKSISELYKALSEGLVSTSPLSIIMDRDQIFVEEEASDQRSSTSRLVEHLKKTGVKSISFLRGLKEEEILKFIKVFTDLKTYGTESAMKRSFPRLHIKNIRINHVIFKKVTLEDKVIDKKDSIKRSPKGFIVPDSAKLEGKIVEVLPPDLAQNLSLDQIIRDPLRFSKDIVKADLSLVSEETERGAGGMLIFQQLRHIRDEILEKCFQMELPSLEKTAEAVQQMRKGLLDEIETQKARGVLFQEGSAIQDEINDLSDQVIIQLVREEYRQGKISIKRLSQVLQRLIPDVSDLKRLLPKIKEALIEEGMLLSDYLELIKELGKAIEDEGLIQALHDGAEEIGLSAEDLIREIRREPKAAAELIALAAEVRMELGKGDENVLTELLVDYVERVSGQMALEAAEKEGQDGGKHLNEIMEKTQQELLERLRGRSLKASILDNTEARLSERMGQGLDQVKSSWIVRQLSQYDPSDVEALQVLRILQNITYNKEDLLPFLELIREKLERDGWDEAHLQKIYDAISEKLAEQTEKDLPKHPKGALARNQILFILQGEIMKALRYPYSFLTLTLRIGSARPKKLVPIGAIRQSDIMYAVLERLANIKRGADYVGAFDKDRGLLIMPVMDSKGGELARERILKDLTADLFEVKGIPMDVEIYSYLYSLDVDQKPLSLKAVVQTIDRNSRE